MHKFLAKSQNLGHLGFDLLTGKNFLYPSSLE